MDTTVLNILIIVTLASVLAPFVFPNTFGNGKK